MELRLMYATPGLVLTSNDSAAASHAVSWTAARPSLVPHVRLPDSASQPEPYPGP